MVDCPDVVSVDAMYEIVKWHIEICFLTKYFVMPQLFVKNVRTGSGQKDDNPILLKEGNC